MLFVDTNSHLTPKPCNFDIKYWGNSESYNGHILVGTNFVGDKN